LKELGTTLTRIYNLDDKGNCHYGVAMIIDILKKAGIMDLSTFTGGICKALVK
jgi:hypothetical protein